ncbi:MAG: glycosyl hydrolase family 28-related protein [Methyloceanibacter sp.]
MLFDHRLPAWLGPAALAAMLAACPATASAEAPRSCPPPPPSALTVNVKDHGAKGDGRADDTAAIQAAIDRAAGSKGAVLVPAGTYMVDAAGGRRLKLRSDMTLKLADGATLKAFPADTAKYSLLTLKDVSNVWVTGGTLEGERDRHKGKGGQGGMGISILGGAKHITVIGVTAKKMWGDGFYVKDAEDVRFCSVTAEFNRRQGMSIIHADGVLVLNSVFKNTRGTRPGAGIDLEPDRTEQEIKNVRIEGSKFINNAGGGIMVSGRAARLTKLELTRNSFTNNRPFVLSSAPAVASGICKNRQANPQTDTSAGLNAYADPVDIVTFQDECGEPSFIVQRQGGKKKTKPQD